MDHEIIIKPQGLNRGLTVHSATSICLYPPGRYWITQDWDQISELMPMLYLAMLISDYGLPWEIKQINITYCSLGMQQISKEVGYRF